MQLPSPAHLPASESEDPMYTLQEIPGKGKGLIAAQKISLGTRILFEKPVIRMANSVLDNPTLVASICEQVNSLALEQRQAFLSMQNIYSDEAASQYLGIFRTNGLPFAAKQVFSLIHVVLTMTCDDKTLIKSCNVNIEQHTIHVMQETKKGQEITISYVGVLNSRGVRQETLQREFAFNCSRRLGFLPPDQSQESDKRLNEILRLDSMIGNGGLREILSAPLQRLR